VAGSKAIVEGGRDVVVEGTVVEVAAESIGVVVEVALEGRFETVGRFGAASLTTIRFQADSLR